MKTSKKILVAENNASLRGRLGKALQHRGLDVLLAKNHVEALTAAARCSPQFAVVELRLPPESALELIPRLQQYSPNIEIIVVSDFGTIRAATESMRLGAVDFVPKPVDVDMLLAKFPSFRQRGAKEVAVGSVAELPSLAQAEWEHIQRVMELTNNNISEAARQLQIDRRSLQRKLQRPVRLV